jgi:hypothetical protein
MAAREVSSQLRRVLDFSKNGGTDGGEYVKTPQNALRSLFCVLMGNSVVFASLIWSISRFYSPIKWPISWYSPPKIAT